mmetsp:Transcript_37123/g.89998  ORF Transcript_37123/g.89998 Transcript_37123/m.89998 type:complete len:732 (+) Transcript_37123:844-3039(+)
MQPDPTTEEEGIYLNTTISGTPDTTTTTNEQKLQEHQQQQHRPSLLQQLLSPVRDEGGGNGSEEEDDDEFGRIVMEDTKRLLSGELGEDTSTGGGSSSSSKPTATAGGSNTAAAPTASTSKPVTNETPKEGEEGQKSQQQTNEGQPETKKTVKRKRKPPLVPWKKPADMPRRPLSAYNLYFKQRREELMKEEEERQHLADLAESSTGTKTHSSRRRKKSNRSVGIGFANLAKTIASEWKELSDGSKAPYEKAALPEKQRYDAAMKIWRAKQKEEKAKAAATAAESKKANKSIASSSGSSPSSPMKRPPSSGSSRNSPAMMDIDSVDHREMSSSVQSQHVYEEQQPYSRRSQPQMAEAPRSNIMGGGMAASMMSFPMHRQQHQHHQQQHQYLSTIQSGMQAPSPILQRQFQLQQQQERRRSGLMFRGSGVEDGAAFMHGHFMSPLQQQQQQQSSSDYRMQMLAHHPNSRMAAMLGMPADEYQQQVHSAPTMMDRQVMRNADIQRHVHQETSLPYSASLERRNTWSGLSSAQQQLYFSTQEAPKDRTNASSYSEVASSQQSASSPLAQQGSSSQTLRGKVYPEDWFQADTNTTGTDLVIEANRAAIEGKSVSDTLKGDLNQKMSASFGSLQTSGVSVKKDTLLDREEATKKALHHHQQQKASTNIDMHRGQKKHSPPTHSSQLEPLSLEGSSSQQSSLRALGMQLDEESVNFLSNLRFGNSSDHSGNSSNESK